MQNIDVKIDAALLNKANNFSKFRNDCKVYLNKVDKNWDKFTMVDHDSKIGYLTEKLLSNYFKSKFPKAVISTWEESFDIKKIIEIINNSDYTDNSVELVKSYFYDHWDLSITLNNKTIYCDVKTALTKLEPKGTWQFLYPVVQANKPGKDISILIYYIVDDIKRIESLKKLCLVGFIKRENITKLNIIKKGDLTSHATVSQIDNYITNVKNDYSLDIESLF